MRTALTSVRTSFGAPVTNLQLIEWVEWVFQQRPQEEYLDLAHGRDALGEPSRLAAGSGIDLAAEIGGLEEPSTKLHKPSVRAEAPAKPI
jgi:hypothetical protein